MSILEDVITAGSKHSQRQTLLKSRGESDSVGKKGPRLSKGDQLINEKSGDVRNAEIKEVPLNYNDTNIAVEKAPSSSSGTSVGLTASHKPTRKRSSERQPKVQKKSSVNRETDNTLPIATKSRSKQILDETSTGETNTSPKSNYVESSAPIEKLESASAGNNLTIAPHVTTEGDVEKLAPNIEPDLASKVVEKLAVETEAAPTKQPRGSKLKNQSVSGRNDSTSTPSKGASAQNDRKHFSKSNSKTKRLMVPEVVASTKRNISISEQEFVNKMNESNSESETMKSSKLLTSKNELKLPVPSLNIIDVPINDTTGARDEPLTEKKRPHKKSKNKKVSKEKDNEGIATLKGRKVLMSAGDSHVRKKLLRKRKDSAEKVATAVDEIKENTALSEGKLSSRGIDSPSKGDSSRVMKETSSMKQKTKNVSEKKSLDNETITKTKSMRRVSGFPFEEVLILQSSGKSPSTTEVDTNEPPIGHLVKPKKRLSEALRPQYPTQGETVYKSTSWPKNISLDSKLRSNNVESSKSEITLSGSSRVAQQSQLRRGISSKITGGVLSLVKKSVGEIESLHESNVLKLNKSMVSTEMEVPHGELDVPPPILPVPTALGKKRSKNQSRGGTPGGKHLSRLSKKAQSKQTTTRRLVRKSHTSQKLQNKPDLPNKNRQQTAIQTGKRSSKKSTGTLKKSKKKKLKKTSDTEANENGEPVDAVSVEPEESEFDHLYCEEVGGEHYTFIEVLGEQWKPPIPDDEALYASLYGEIEEPYSALVMENPPGTPEFVEELLKEDDHSVHRKDLLKDYSEEETFDRPSEGSISEGITAVESETKSVAQTVVPDEDLLKLQPTEVKDDPKIVGVADYLDRTYLQDQVPTVDFQTSSSFQLLQTLDSEKIDSSEVGGLYEDYEFIDFQETSSVHDLQRVPPVSIVSSKKIEKEKLTLNRTDSLSSIDELGSLLEADHDILSRICPDLDLTGKCSLLYPEEQRSSISSHVSSGDENAEFLAEDEAQELEVDELLDHAGRGEQVVEDSSGTADHDETDIDEQIVLDLMEKVIALQRKANWCDYCKKPYTAQCVNHPASPSSMSFTDSFILEDYLNRKEVLNDKELTVNESDLEIEREMKVLTKNVYGLCDKIGSLQGKPSSQSVNDKNEDDDGNDDPAQFQTAPGVNKKIGWHNVKRQLEKIIALLEKKRAKKEMENYIAVGGEDGEIYYERKPSLPSYTYRDFPGEGGKRLNIFDYLDYLDTYAKRQLTKEEAKRLRLQRYLLGLTKHWSRDDQSASTYNQDRSEWSEYFDNGDDSDVEDILGFDQKFWDSDKSKIDKKERARTNEGTPFACKCFCDRISRLNPKKHEHFRPVLNENLWCFRTTISDNKEDETVAKKYEAIEQQSIGEKGNEVICQREVVEETTNFRGWLSDADRNLLLLTNRDPLERLDPSYYEKTGDWNHLPVISEEESEKVNKDKLIKDLLNKISLVESERFWERVEGWYSDYRSRDKIRKFIECLETVDLCSMLRRDLKLMKDQVDRDLAIAKKQIELKIKEQKKKELDEMCASLEKAFEDDLNDFLAEKELTEKERKDFTVRCTMLDAREKLSPLKIEYKQTCLRWMEQLKDRQCATSLTMKQKRARQLALMVDKFDIAERMRKKLIAASGRQHEEVEQILVKGVEDRKVVIEQLQRKIVNLARDVSIWKEAAGETLKSLRNFMCYIRCQNPERAPYVLNLERLYQIAMDGLFKEASTSEGLAEKSELTTSSRPGSRTLQSAMEIKCPSRDIRFPSELTRKTGSSSDTDIEADVQAEKVAKHVVDWTIKAALPTPEPSVEIMEDENGKEELEELINHFVVRHGRKAPHSEESESTRNGVGEEPPITEATDSESQISVEEFTRRRIKDMIQIIANAKPFFKTHIRL